MSVVESHIKVGDVYHVCFFVMKKFMNPPASVIIHVMTYGKCTLWAGASSVGFKILIVLACLHPCETVFIHLIIYLIWPTCLFLDYSDCLIFVWVRVFCPSLDGVTYALDVLLYHVITRLCNVMIDALWCFFK